MWLLLATALAADLPLDRCVDTRRLAALDRIAVAEAVDMAYVKPLDALVVLERVTRAWPTCDAVWMARAGVLHGLGREEAALESLRRAEEVAQGPEAKRAFAVALHRRSSGGAVLQRAALASPDDPLLKVLAARELPLSGRADALLRAVEVHPDHEPLLVEALETLTQAGRPSEAIVRGRAWVDRPGSWPELRATLTRLEAPFTERTERRIQRPAELRTLSDGTEEVVVYSPGRAKRALIERLEVLGYTEAKTLNGGVRFRSERPVSPYVDVFEDGRVEVQKSGRVKPAPLPDGRTMIPSISARKLRPDRVRVMEAMNYEVSAWRQALTLQRFQTEVETRLPDRLSALWERGEPLYGEEILPTLLERREALVAHWATRACTPDGQAVRSVVERFIRNVVQDSEVALDTAALGRVEGLCEGTLLDLE